MATRSWRGSGAGEGTGEERLYRALDFLLNDEAYRRDCGIFMIEVTSFAARNEVIAAALARYYEIYFDLFSGIVKTLNPSLPPRGARAVRASAWRLSRACRSRARIWRPKGEADFSAREAARAIMRLVTGGET